MYVWQCVVCGEEEKMCEQCSVQLPVWEPGKGVRGVLVGRKLSFSGASQVFVNARVGRVAFSPRRAAGRRFKRIKVNSAGASCVNPGAVRCWAEGSSP